MDKRKKALMMKNFEAFMRRIEDKYRQAYLALELDDYVGAQQILAQLAQSHARTSMSLRGVLVREGLIEEDNK